MAAACHLGKKVYSSNGIVICKNRQKLILLHRQFVHPQFVHHDFQNRVQNTDHIWRYDVHGMLFAVHAPKRTLQEMKHTRKYRS